MGENLWQARHQQVVICESVTADKSRGISWIFIYASNDIAHQD